MNTLHYDYNTKKDIFSVYCVKDNVSTLLGSISILNTSTETKESFLNDMIAAKERLEPSKAPWHANELFDDQGRLKALTIRKYGNRPQWFLKRQNGVKTEVVKPHQLEAQVEYYTQQILFQHAIPMDVITANVVRHAVRSLFKDATFNRF